MNLVGRNNIKYVGYMFNFSLTFVNHIIEIFTKCLKMNS